MVLLDDFFDSMVDIPCLKHGNRQSMGSLINKETLILGKYLKNEKKYGSPELFYSFYKWLKMILNII